MITIQGNGNIITRQVQVSSFIRLHASVSGLAELVQGEEEKVEVETDENLQEYIDVVNSGRTLYVTSEGKWQSPKFTSLKVKIYCRQLYTIHNHCSKGQLSCANTIVSTEPVEIKIHCDQGTTNLNIKAPSIKLTTACVGNTILQGECNLLEIKASSQGDLDTSGMKAKTVAFKNYSEGNIKLYASEAITISNFGKGNIDYFGDGILKDINQYGSGQVKHNKLLAE